MHQVLNKSKCHSKVIRKIFHCLAMPILFGAGMICYRNSLWTHCFSEYQGWFCKSWNSFYPVHKRHLCNTFGVNSSAVKIREKVNLTVLYRMNE